MTNDSQQCQILWGLCGMKFTPLMVHLVGILFSTDHGWMEDYSWHSYLNGCGLHLTELWSPFISQTIRLHQQWNPWAWDLWAFNGWCVGVVVLQNQGLSYWWASCWMLLTLCSSNCYGHSCSSWSHCIHANTPWSMPPGSEQYFPNGHNNCCWS